MSNDRKATEGRVKLKKVSRKLIKKLICQHCGSEFESQRGSTKYCSGMCRQAAYRERKL